LKPVNRIVVTMTAIMLSIAVLPAPCVASVVINEVELNPPQTPGSTEWVELYNRGPQDVDLSGWKVVIVSTVPGESGGAFSWQGQIPIPSGTVLQADGYLVLVGQSSWQHGINATAILYDASSQEVDNSLLLVDSKNDGFTWSRFPNGKDEDRSADWAYVPSTRGRENTLPIGTVPR